MIRYSIIIPHYNTPTLLARCIESIPHRNDIQIIVVDDSSSQEHQKMLKVLTHSYNHVQFIFFSKNGGAGAARNIGLTYAKGEWILFADADDYFSPSFINELDRYKSCDADIIFFNAKSEEAINDRTSHLKKIYSLQNHNSIQHLLRYSFGEPWCKMIRRKLIQSNRISFEESFIHNDTKFSYLIGFHAKKIYYSLAVIYSVTKQQQSVSQQVSPKVLEQRAKVFAEKNHFLRINHINYFDWQMMSPLWDGIKNLNINFIKEYFSICRSKDYSFVFIVSQFVIYVFKVLHSKATRSQII